MTLLFSETFIHIGIVCALVATAIAAVSLIGMFIRDAIKKEIW